MHKSMLKAISFIIILGFFNFSTLATEYVNKITIEGNKRVEISTIQNYLKLKIGSEYNLHQQSEAIKSLYGTGLFEDINIKFVNGNLIIIVAETPFVSSVSFKGNSKIKEAIFIRELLIQPGDSLSKAKIQSDVEKIRELYKRSGRFSTKVEAIIEKQENNRVRVVFDIHEGPKTAIKRIYFAGNINYSENDLRSIILTKEESWLSFMSTNDTYDPDRIDYDKHLLKTFYQSVGFADFRVISATAELSKTKEYFTLTFSIDEGDKYNVGKIEIDNKLKNVDISEIQQFIAIKTGQTFNMNAIDDIVENIADNLSDKGYPQVDVHNDINPNISTKTVDVKFIVDKADKVFVGDIEISGNMKTEDRVIRREYKIEEGDIFNKSYVDKGEQNLRNLNYFEKVSTKISPTNQKDRYNVMIDVQEKSTSAIGFDLGFNSSSGVFGRLSFLERNLVGTGNTLSVGLQGSKRNKNYHIGVTNPRFLDKNLSLSGRFNKSDSGRSGSSRLLGGDSEQAYDLKTIGFETALGYEIMDDLSHEIEYKIKRDKLDALAATSSQFVLEQAGKSITSSIGQTIAYDKTDSRVIPKNGYVASVSQEFAGLGGTNKYLKHEIDGKYFKSFVNNQLTLKVTGTVGNITGVAGKNVRISDRFNLGGDSLRGFASGGIGPRDIKNKEGLGGQNSYTLGTELNFPLGAPKEFDLTGAVFAEMGSVFGVTLKKGSTYTRDKFHDDKSLRASVGIGILWITRVAPIRIDYAWAVKKKKYDDLQHFHFKFSTSL